jgi:replicative DNA helicase
MELKIPLVVCAQLSRANTARADKRPQLNDIRDSGSIEQDADVILFIHREGYYKPKEERADDTEGEIIVAKQRNGPVGTVNVEWVAKYARYENEAGILVPQFAEREENVPF